MTNRNGLLKTNSARFVTVRIPFLLRKHKLASSWRFYMKALMVLFLLLAASAAFCARQVSEIPVTTQSKEALQAFQKGLYDLDVTRALEARAEFQKAVHLDPTFAHA